MTFEPTGGRGREDVRLNDARQPCDGGTRNRSPRELEVVGQRREMNAHELNVRGSRLWVAIAFGPELGVHVRRQAKAQCVLPVQSEISLPRRADRGQILIAEMARRRVRVPEAR